MNPISYRNPKKCLSCHNAVIRCQRGASLCGNCGVVYCDEWKQMLNKNSEVLKIYLEQLQKNDKEKDQTAVILKIADLLVKYLIQHRNCQKQRVCMTRCRPCKIKILLTKLNYIPKVKLPEKYEKKQLNLLYKNETPLLEEIRKKLVNRVKNNISPNLEKGPINATNLAALPAVNINNTHVISKSIISRETVEKPRKEPKIEENDQFSDLVPSLTEDLQISPDIALFCNRSVSSYGANEADGNQSNDNNNDNNNDEDELSCNDSSSCDSTNSLFNLSIDINTNSKDHRQDNSNIEIEDASKKLVGTWINYYNNNMGSTTVSDGITRDERETSGPLSKFNDQGRNYYSSEATNTGLSQEGSYYLTNNAATCYNPLTPNIQFKILNTVQEIKLHRLFDMMHKVYVDELTGQARINDIFDRKWGDRKNNEILPIDYDQQNMMNLAVIQRSDQLKNRKDCYGGKLKELANATWGKNEYSPQCTPQCSECTPHPKTIQILHGLVKDIHEKGLVSLKTVNTLNQTTDCSKTIDFLRDFLLYVCHISYDDSDYQKIIQSECLRNVRGYIYLMQQIRNRTGGGENYFRLHNQIMTDFVRMRRGHKILCIMSNYLPDSKIFKVNDRGDFISFPTIAVAAITHAKLKGIKDCDLNVGEMLERLLSLSKALHRMPRYLLLIIHIHYMPMMLSTSILNYVDADLMRELEKMDDPLILLQSLSWGFGCFRFL